MLATCLPAADDTPVAMDYLQARHQAQQLARQQAIKAQNRQAQQANRHRRFLEFQPEP